MGGPPVRLEIIGQVLTSVFQLVLVQNYVEHLLNLGLGQDNSIYRWALSKFLSGNHLHVHVPHLDLATRLDEPLEHLGRADFDIYMDGGQRRLGELGRMVDRVAI